jgi:hypothetical protein
MRIDILDSTGLLSPGLLAIAGASGHEAVSWNMASVGTTTWSVPPAPVLEQTAQRRVGRSALFGSAIVVEAAAQGRDSRWRAQVLSDLGDLRARRVLWVYMMGGRRGLRGFVESFGNDLAPASTAMHEIRVRLQESSFDWSVAYCARPTDKRSTDSVVSISRRHVARVPGRHHAVPSEALARHVLAQATAFRGGDQEVVILSRHDWVPRPVVDARF